MSLNDEMKRKRKENPVVAEVADILVKRVCIENFFKYTKRLENENFTFIIMWK